MAIKVAVTGVEGFLGKHLSKTLLEVGFEVFGVDSKLGADIRDTESLRKAFAHTKYVFHCAAKTSVPYSIENPVETHDINVNGTFSALIAARDVGVSRFIFSSSAAVYGDQTQLPLGETVPSLPISPYGLHKYIGELYCKMFSKLYGLQTVSLRYFNIYGPGAPTEGAYAGIVARFLALRRAGKSLTITGNGTQTRDLVHVRDIADANLRAANSTFVGNGEVINIGSGTSVSVLDLANKIGGPITYLPARDEIQDSLADNSLAKKLLGWEAKISLEEGITELKKLANLE